MALSKSESKALPLRQGDQVIAVAPSSALSETKQLSEGLLVLESWGLVCMPHKLVERRWGYLAGDDDSRWEDLHPPKPVPLMACARGGWGASRLLERGIQWKSGWLLGFSDVTALLWARLAAGIDGGIHGPLLTTLAAEPEWSQSRLRGLLFGEDIPALEGEIWQGGLAVGQLVVANLTVASHLIGSKYIPDLSGAILILEDVGEAPYRIDRMLTQWRLAGLLQQIAGLGFGSFKDCQPSNHVEAGHTFQLEEVLKERSSDLPIPVLGHLPVGHLCGNAALPLGRKACLDGNSGLLSLLI